MRIRYVELIHCFDVSSGGGSVGSCGPTFHNSPLGSFGSLFGFNNRDRLRIVDPVRFKLSFKVLASLLRVRLLLGRLLHLDLPLFLVGCDVG